MPAANRMSPPGGEQAPSFRPQPRIYGRPISPAEVDAPLPSRVASRLPGQPVYSDLLGPVQQQAGSAAGEQRPQESGAPSPPAPPPPAGPPPAGPLGSRDERTAFHQAAPFSPEPLSPAANESPATTPASPAPAPALPPPGDEPGSAGPDGPAGPELAPPGRSSGLPVSLITGMVLVAAALVVLVALAVPLLLQQLGSDPEAPYAVGDCVVQDGTSAVPAECDEPGAFRVVLEVERIEDCPDYPAQHAITVSEPPAVFCVSPVEAAGVEG